MPGLKTEHLSHYSFDNILVKGGYVSNIKMIPTNSTTHLSDHYAIMCDVIF